MGNRVAAGLIVATALLGAPAATLVATAGPAAAGATVVSTEAELRAAFDTESSLVLVNDIEISDCDGGGAVTRSANAPVTLDGAGFTITQTCVDNVFEPDQSDVTLQNVTLTGGREPDDGGAIDMNGGNLTVINSTLVGNCAADSAGAIENEDGDTTIVASTLTGNDADDQGGAVRSKRGNTLIVNSTVTGNTQAQLGAVDSGQLDQADASLTLVYNTIVANANDTSIDCDVGIMTEPTPTPKWTWARRRSTPPMSTPSTRSRRSVRLWRSQPADRTATSRLPDPRATTTPTTTAAPSPLRPMRRTAPIRSWVPWPPTVGPPRHGFPRRAAR